MANVLFTRKNASEIPNVPITDGQLIFDTSGNGKMYLDNGTNRLEMGGALTVDASLSKTSTNAIQNKAVTGNILNSLAEVSAATQQNTIAGALALKEVNSSLNSKVSNFTSGNYKAVTGLAYDATNKKLGLKVGADTVIPFSGGLNAKTGTFITTSTSNTYTVDLGFNPSKLALLLKQTNSSYTFIVYNADIESGYFYQAVSDGTVARPDITSNTSNNRLRLIENGFTLRPCLNGTWHYFAIE